MKLSQSVLILAIPLIFGCSSIRNESSATDFESQIDHTASVENCSNLEYLRTDLYSEVVPASISNLSSDGLEILSSDPNIYLHFGNLQAVLWRGNCIPMLDYYQIQSLVFRSQIIAPLLQVDQDYLSQSTSSFDIKLDAQHPSFEHYATFVGAAEIDRSSGLLGGGLQIYLGLWNGESSSILGLYKQGMLTASNEVGFSPVTPIIKSKTKLKTFYFLPYPDANGGSIWIVQEVSGGLMVYPVSYDFSHFN